jgi:hypothetical protein
MEKSYQKAEEIEKKLNEKGRGGYISPGVRGFISNMLGMEPRTPLITRDITAEKVEILQNADDTYMKMLNEYHLYDKVWQAGAILLPVNSVGVMGDERTYEEVVALRAVESTDGMTADWVHLPYDFLMKISNEIIDCFFDWDDLMFHAPIKYEIEIFLN